MSADTSKPVPAPRITPGSRAEVGWFTWGFAAVSGRVTGTQPPNLFLTLGRQRKLFRGWLRFAGRLMPGGTLPRRETEMVILRVAHLRSCEYEFEHHRKLGRRVGVTDRDVTRIVEGSDAEGWSDRERLLLRCVDQLHHDRDLSDRNWNELRAELSEAQAVEFLLLVGHYEMLATTIQTLRIRTDEPRR